MEDDMPGTALVRELLEFHEILRSRLRRCSELARNAAAGLPHDQAGSERRGPAADSSLRELRDSCISHCSLLHRHHGGEDTALFPELRNTDLDLAPVLDRLEAEHHAISVLAEQVNRIAESLSGTGSEPVGIAAATRLRQALSELEDQLLKHLAAEEHAIVPALMRWREWPQL